MTKFKDMDALAEHIHEVSTSKGFTAPDHKNLPAKLLLSVSELVEAMEEHRNGNPLVYFKCGACGAESPTPVNKHEIPRKGVVAYVLRYLRIHRSTAALPCEGSIDKPEGILVEIADSTIRNLHMMQSLIEEYNRLAPTPFPYSVSELHRVKVEFNESRPHLHGGRAY